jgi:uncharacterized protein with NRDE domain
MCLIAIAFRAHPDFHLVVAANRDEWRARPAAPAAWWGEHPDLLAGRDLEAGGTWLGVTRAGRFAAVTNFRDPSERSGSARSRGDLVTSFLLGRAAPHDFVRELASRASDYRGFNLLVGDGERLVCFESRGGMAREVEPGVHALSNHLLDEPWPKVRRARAAMSAAVATGDDGLLFEMLSDAAPAPDDELPDTGVGLAWERRLAPPLITGVDYGTRVSTVLRLTPSGVVRFEERTRDAAGAVTTTAAFTFERVQP